MAKTLHYRRHSIKDGADGQTIGPKGIDLAVNEGAKLSEIDSDEFGFDMLFHGPLVRTAQTAYAFVDGLGYVPELMPVVPEIGTDALFAEMANDAFRAEVKGGASNFEAVLAAHGVEKAKKWAGEAFAGVVDMFWTMGNSETAIAFGHSPIIELAAWRAIGFCETTPDELTKLGDMEGIIFQAVGGTLVIEGKISVEK